jgi:ribosome-associated heat shock protein Hsp15
MQPLPHLPPFYYSAMSRNDDHEQDDDGRLRLDKWLWAARFFKTRSLAAEAVTGGKVTMHGDRVKPARPLQVGDLLSIRLGPYEHVVRVRELSARRGPAPVAATLYEETAESLAARTRLAEQLRLSPAPLVYEEKGRPTKRDRREIDRWRQR